MARHVWLKLRYAEQRGKIRMAPVAKASSGLKPMRYRKLRRTLWRFLSMPIYMKYVAGSLLAAAALSGAATATAVAQKPFHIEQTWKIGGDGGWDYLSVDANSHRLYVAHSTKVDAIDLRTGKLVGQVTGLMGTHGVVISPDGKTGYISDGRANAVVTFDPATLQATGKIATGKNPDGMVYEPATNSVWAFNGGSNDVTVIDTQSKTVKATIKLPGRPEFPATSHGSVFVNIEDKNSIVMLNAKDLRISETYPLKECKSPSGLAMDEAGGRLFSVCDGKKMVVTSAKDGKQLGAPTIGEGPDAAGYDTKHNLAFASNGEGTLSIVDASKPGYPVIQTLTTQKGARTMAFDETTGKVYLAAAEYGKPEAVGKRPPVLPGSFKVLVVGRE